jgi:hypothetical protein
VRAGSPPACPVTCWSRARAPAQPPTPTGPCAASACDRSR